MQIGPRLLPDIVQKAGIAYARLQASVFDSDLAKALQPLDARTLPNTRRPYVVKFSRCTDSRLGPPGRPKLDLQSGSFATHLL